MTENAATADALIWGRFGVWGTPKKHDASVFSQLGKGSWPVKANFVAGKKTGKEGGPQTGWLNPEEREALRKENKCLQERRAFGS